MAFTAEDFEIDYFGVSLHIQVLEMQGRVVFRVIFSDGQKDLFITRATLTDGRKYWMSVPEDSKRQEDAVMIGRTIVAYFKAQKNV
ncbi:hypothetical protein ACN9ML_18365 [Dyadobacter endophyticus]|uniref:hypothetical protein n=1 Tax=Dyadobacter endophyticus TaxID=1749036 RepID=UPI003CEB79FD